MDQRILWRPYPNFYVREKEVEAWGRLADPNVAAETAKSLIKELDCESSRLSVKVVAFRLRLNTLHVPISKFLRQMCPDDAELEPEVDRICEEIDHELHALSQKTMEGWQDSDLNEKLWKEVIQLLISIKKHYSKVANRIEMNSSKINSVLN